MRNIDTSAFLGALLLLPLAVLFVLLPVVQAFQGDPWGPLIPAAVIGFFAWQRRYGLGSPRYHARQRRKARRHLAESAKP